MTQAPDDLLSQLWDDIETVAVHIATCEEEKAELQQEMVCELLTLPPGHTRAWYLSRMGDCARKYYYRTMQDIPLNHAARPVFERRTLYVGGLAELDRISRLRRAA
jgi:hypothetical protein